MGAFLMPNHLDHFKGPLKELLHNSDKAAKKAKPKPKRKPPRELAMSEYSGKAGGHKDFGRFKADMAVTTDQRKGLQKPVFRGEDGRLNYHQFNGKGENSSFRDVNDKQEEVLQRNQQGKIQTKREVRGSFHKDKPQVAGLHSHHRAPIKALSFLFDELDEFEARQLINHFEKRGVYIGNDPRNADHMPDADHASVHDEYVKKEILKYNHASLAGMPVKDRIKFANVLIQEIKEAKKIVDQVFYSGSEYSKGYQETFNF